MGRRRSSSRVTAAASEVCGAGALALTVRTAAQHANKVAFATVVLTRQSYALPAGHTRRVTLQL
jgi:uncharacterized membrane protein YadS